MSFERGDFLATVCVPKLDRIVITSRSDLCTVGAVNDAFYEVSMSGECLDFLTDCCVPKLNRIATSRCDPRTVEAESHARYEDSISMSFERLDFLTADCVPKLDRPVQTSRCNLRAIGTESDAKNRVCMSFERVDFLTADCVPCLLYTSPSPRDQRGSRMPSSA